MLRHSIRSRFALVALAAAAVCLTAANTGPIRRLTVDRTAPRVELFDGLDRGIVTARVVTRDESQAAVFITNTTNVPQSVEIPAAVAAVQVLKQFPPLGQTGLGQQNGQTGTGTAQDVAGQLFPSGAQQGNFDVNNPLGSGFFTIPPEKTVQIELRSVCLDHGKPTPTPRMSYELRRIEEQISDGVLRTLIETADFARTDRRAVQAAAWHLSDGLTWKDLRTKTVHRGAGIRVPYFNKRQLQTAEKLVEAAGQAAAPDGERRTTDDPVAAVPSQRATDN